VIANSYVAVSRHEPPAASPEWTCIDRRRLVTSALDPGDLNAYIEAGWNVTPNFGIYVETVHRIGESAAVLTHRASGTSSSGFDAEWRTLSVVTIKDGLIDHCELFDEADLDAALARFEELDRRAPQLDNAAVRCWRRAADAINRRDLQAFLSEAAPHARWEDRRRLLSAEGEALPEVVRAVFEMSAGWHIDTDVVAIRGSHLALTRDTYRDRTDPLSPVTLEQLTLMEVGDDGIGRTLILFDPDDIHAALAELTSRWIASGVVAHPDVIELSCRQSDLTNNHDWDELDARCGGATYINHRQLGDQTADMMSGIRVMETLVPDVRIEQADFLAVSANGTLSHMVIRGTSPEGLAIEIPFLHVNLFEGDRSTHIETYDLGDRDEAIRRFEELTR
jgi:hypothetical protein